MDIEDVDEALGVCGEDDESVGEGCNVSMV